MIKFKTIGISFIACTVFGAAGCMAQATGGPEISIAVPLPVPHATQIERCQDMGRYVKIVAAARDAGEAQQHFVGRLGLNMSAPSGLGLIHQRLPANTVASGGSALVSAIYASNASPLDWQKQVLLVCEKHVSQT